MAKKKPDDLETIPRLDGAAARMLRAPAEVLYAEEIEQLIKEDQHERPPGWRMSEMRSAP